MKKHGVIAVVLLFTFAFTNTVFSEGSSSGAAPNLGLFMMQQQLQAMRVAHSDPDATGDMGAAAILDTWTGKAPTMKPDGTCTTTNVEVKIEKQCGNLVKGYIKALGVQVPVEGEYYSNILILLGIKPGSVSWIASIFAIYAPTTDSFTVQLFSFQKTGLVMNNVYDSGWKLIR
jgi:hypothetical protein